MANFQDLLSALFQNTGYPDPTQNRLDWRLQQYKDALNTIQDEIAATTSPKLQGLVRESTLTTVIGTMSYTLDDYCARISELRSADDSFAYKIPQRRSRNVDREGLRASTRVPTGPYGWDYEVGPRTQQSLYSSTYPDGVAFQNNLTTYGASASNGSTTITFGSGVTPASAWVGHMLTLNGEGNDYKVISVVSSAGGTCVVDRAIRSKCSGTGVSGQGSDYASVSWDVSPPERQIVRILPKPNVVATINYRFVAQPRRLVNLTDRPEIDGVYHDLLWKGAMRIVGAAKQNPEMYAVYQGEYNSAMAMFQKINHDDEDSDDVPPVQTLEGVIGTEPPQSTYSRRRGQTYTRAGGWM